MNRGAVSGAGQRKRSIGRRREDFEVRKRLGRYHQVYRVGRILTSETDLARLFSTIMVETNRIMETERTTVFLHNPDTDQLWSFVGTGIDRDKIRISVDQGVAGWVFHHREPVVIADAYGDPRFYNGIDRISGFRTRNILCIPLINRAGNCIGALESLNKIEGEYTKEDLDLLTAISHFVAVALENAQLFDQIRSMDKAKHRILHHLSHELKTPLAVISGSLRLLARDIEHSPADSWRNTLERGERNITRLLDLQRKIGDVLNSSDENDRDVVLRIVEDAADLVAETGEFAPAEIAEAIFRIRDRIEGLFAVQEVDISLIHIDRILEKVCDSLEAQMAGRDLEIRRSLSPVSASSDAVVIETVLAGLLKNAVENTPDGGRIEVRCQRGDLRTEVLVRDTGVGISEENQKLIFGGFFHTQSTGRYRSGRPYTFGAGGTGADLLRAKAFSQRLGFEIDFSSRRCPLIPEDTDVCPGCIDACTHIASRQECLESGGSLFRVSFR